jgi:hypothetical protein
MRVGRLRTPRRRRPSAQDERASREPVDVWLDALRYADGGRLSSHRASDRFLSMSRVGRDGSSGEPAWSGVPDRRALLDQERVWWCEVDAVGVVEVSGRAAWLGHEADPTMRLLFQVENVLIPLLERLVRAVERDAAAP